VDGPEASTVAGGHVLVQRLNRISSGQLSVLLVHVVGARSRVVADPDAEVLDLEGVLLVDLEKNKLRYVNVGGGPPARTALTLTISPVAFLTFFRPRKKYQYRDLATTSFGAKIRIRYRLGVGLVSVGRCLPITWYSLRRPEGTR